MFLIGLTNGERGEAGSDSPLILLAAACICTHFPGYPAGINDDG